jgi:hypothetical protein
MAGPLGCCWWVRQRPPLKLKKMSMADPLRVLSVGLAAATTEDEEDVDGGPLGGGYWWVQQWPHQS